MELGVHAQVSVFELGAWAAEYGKSRLGSGGFWAVVATGIETKAKAGFQYLLPLLAEGSAGLEINRAAFYTCKKCVRLCVLHFRLTCVHTHIYIYVW